jgi:hypothetical protein
VNSAVMVRSNAKNVVLQLRALWRCNSRRFDVVVGGIVALEITTPTRGVAVLWRCNSLHYVALQQWRVKFFVFF